MEIRTPDCRAFKWLRPIRLLNFWSSLHWVRFVFFVLIFLHWSIFRIYRKWDSSSNLARVCTHFPVSCLFWKIFFLFLFHFIFTVCRWTKVHIVNIYGIFGIYSSGGKSRQKARILPNGDYFWYSCRDLNTRSKWKMAPETSNFGPAFRCFSKCSFQIFSGWNLNALNYLNTNLMKVLYSANFSKSGSRLEVHLRGDYQSSDM